MLSITLAEQLKDAGLTWTPALHDFFVLPGRDLDEQVFVISDMMVDVEKLRNQHLITFNGAPEWAMDYVLVSDALWMPTETQLRDALEQALLNEPQPIVRLATTLDGYRCEVHWQGESRFFEAFGAGEAYGRALLFVMLEQQS
jgi:hypothetical protein